MTVSDRYKSPEAFKTALEQRVRRQAEATGSSMDRVRQLLVFDRFIARATQAFGERLILKGGMVLELRLEHARTTVDLDWRMAGTPSATLFEELQRAAGADLGDGISFLVGVNRKAPKFEGTVYDGQRFWVEARLASKIYGSPFGVDIGFGDPLVGQIDIGDGPPWLEFIGIPATHIRLYPRASHIAEKLHAFTMPRPTPNSRVKDLPDIALLAQTGPIAATELRKALEAAFGFRKSHALPPEVPAAPARWIAPYALMATGNKLPWPNLAAVESVVQAFLNPVLASATLSGTWSPASQSWNP